MDIQTRKIRFVQEFLKIQNDQVISQLEKALRNGVKSLGQDDVKPMTIEAFNKRIDQSMEDSKNGKLIEGSKLKAKMEKWG